VENHQIPAACCSACTGDYEDPDWSAWDDPEDDHPPDEFAGDFPAEEVSQ